MSPVQFRMSSEPDEADSPTEERETTLDLVWNTVRSNTNQTHAPDRLDEIFSSLDRFNYMPDSLKYDLKRRCSLLRSTTGHSAR